MKQPEGSNFHPDVDELILFNDPQYIGDTYIFEPSPTEEQLGYLLVAVETENREGAGKELLDTTLQALQREYFRDPSRGVLASFESALHQTNLILHDISEQGMRDWMGYFHAAVGILAGSTLHISTAGNAAVLLIRRSRVTVVSVGLSHSPITNPLRTFSHVASGMVTKNDMLLFTTSHFEQLFRNEDIARFAITHSATTVTVRLKQLYEDQGEELPFAALAVFILPKRFVRPQKEGSPPAWRSPRTPITKNALTPRRPLVIHQSVIVRLALLFGRITTLLGHHIVRVVWPIVKQGGSRGGHFLVQVSHAASRGVHRIASSRTSPLEPTAERVAAYSSEAQQLQSMTSWLRFSPQKLNISGIQSLPRRLIVAPVARFRKLPVSSKVFATLSLLLTITLLVSFILLQKKRTEDRQFRHASELLHAAQTKKDAAEAALIYDNRDQARVLLLEAQKLRDELAVLDLYRDQNQKLTEAIAAVQDRLEKVLRITGETVHTIGDFGEALNHKQPTSLFVIADRLYTFDPTDNKIAVMDTGGTVTVASTTTQGVGYFTTGTTQDADKVLVLVTDEPGVALFDTKTQLLQKQEISLSSDKAAVVSLATFGNRLYVYDQTTHNIYSYSKTLRGYADGSPWITATDFPRDTIVSMGIDGFIYTLHEDGTIRKLYRGTVTDFTQEAVQPPLQRASRLLTRERFHYLYVLDSEGKRVVIFDKKGALQRQIFIEEAAAIADIAVTADETTLYILDGTRVLTVSLAE